MGPLRSASRVKRKFFSPPAFLCHSRFAPSAAQRKKPRKARPVEQHVDSVRCEAVGSAKEPKKYIIVIIAKLTCFSLFPDVGE